MYTVYTHIIKYTRHAYSTGLRDEIRSNFIVRFWVKNCSENVGHEYSPALTVN